MPTSDGDTPELKKNWVLSGVALLLGICVVALAVIDYIQSPPDHKGIEVGPIFIPIGPSKPSTHASSTPAPGHGGTTPGSPTAVGRCWAYTQVGSTPTQTQRRAQALAA